MSISSVFPMLIKMTGALGPLKYFSNWNLVPNHIEPFLLCIEFIVPKWT